MGATISYHATPSLSRVGGVSGNILLFWASPTEYMQSLYDHFGDVVPLGYKPNNVFVFGPARNREILTNPDVFENHSFEDISYFQHSKEYARELALGLGFLNGPVHRERRRLLRPSFLKESVSQYTPTFVSLTERMLTSWEGRETFEIVPEFMNLAVSMGLKTLMGLDPSPTADKVKALFEGMFGLVFSLSYALFPVNLPGTTYRKSIGATQNLSAAITELIEHKRQAGLREDDILSQLIRLQAENPEFTGPDLIGTVTGLFRGMYPNIASALVCITLLLALHPKVTEEVLQEINDRLQGRTITAEDLDHLPLLEGVVMEALRLLPPQYWLVRISRTPYVMNGYEYPAGTNVLLSPYVTQRMPELYPDPDRFIPRRWIGVQHQPFAFIPFAGGVRHCLGSVYSMHLCMTVMASILQRYSISLLPHTQLDLVGLRRAFPRDGTHVKIDRPGVPVLPTDLSGNYTRFIKVSS
jgi:cytochrome P450